MMIIFLIIFAQGLSWGEATANPAAHFLSWFDGNMGALEGITRWYLKLGVKWDLNEILETKKNRKGWWDLGIWCYLYSQLM